MEWLFLTGQFPDRKERRKGGIRAHSFLLGEWVKGGFKKQAVQIEGGSKGQGDQEVTERESGSHQKPINPGNTAP